MRAFFAVTLLLLGVGLQAHATQVPQAQEFPFELRDGLIWVEVEATASATKLNFLLDSGAEVSVLDLGTVHRLGLGHGRPVLVQGVGARGRGYWPENLSAVAGNVSLPRSYLAADLSQLSGACSHPVDGLIGADFFSGRTVQIDFAARKIRLLDSSPHIVNGETIPLKHHHGSFLVPIRVNHGPAQWVRVDTGCASSLQWVTGSTWRFGVARQRAVALAPVSIETTPTTVQLGATSFLEVPTGLHQQPIFPGESGLLGLGLLSRFKSVTIDTEGGRIALVP